MLRFAAYLLAFTFAVTAQAQTKSPKETYLAYRKAVIAATKVEDTLLYHTAEFAAKVRAEPAQNQAFGLEIMKGVYGLEKDPKKVVSETINGGQATVKAEHCAEGERATSNVSLVLVGTTWKIGKYKLDLGREACN